MRQVLVSLQEHEAAVRQLRCAVEVVPDEMFSEYLRLYLVLLGRLTDPARPGFKFLAERAFAVVRPHAPLGWQHAGQLPTEEYVAAAELAGSAPQPVHHAFCDNAEAGTDALCTAWYGSFAKIREEVDALVKRMELRNEDLFEPAEPAELEAGTVATGGFIRLFDQRQGRVDRAGCALLPKACAVLNAMPALFRRVQRPDTTTPEWDGVLGEVRLVHVRPWTRLHADARGPTNARWTALLPVLMKVEAKEPRPWLKAGGERLFLTEGQVSVFDDSFVTEFFNPSNRSRFVLQLHTFKPVLCRAHRCAGAAAELLDPALRDAYTMGGRVPVMDWFLDRVMQATGESAAEEAAVEWDEATLTEHLVAFTPSALMQRAYGTQQLHAALQAESSGGEPVAIPPLPPRLPRDTGMAPRYRHGVNTSLTQHAL